MQVPASGGGMIALWGMAWRSGWLAALLALALAAGCRPERGSPPDAGADGGPAPSADLPTLEHEPGLGAEAVQGPLWRQAESLDPIDLGRLAEALGGGALAAAAQRSAEHRAVALAALPFAPDRELTLGRLCRIVGAGPPARRAWLVALHAVLESLPPDAERLDIQGARSCVPVLRWLASVPSVSAADRDLAAAGEAALLAWMGPP